MAGELESIDKEKSAFMQEMESLRPDLYYADAWSTTDKDVALEELREAKVKSGILSSIPMVCKGPKCYVSDTCPLQQKGLAPIGLSCPIELALVQQFFMSYVDELDVDTDRMVEVSMVRSLVDQEVQYLRKTKVLSLENFIQENVIGIDPKDGSPILKSELHMAVELEDKIHRRMERLRNQLLATRESRAKAGQGSQDAAKAIADILEKASAVQTRAEKILNKKLNREFVDTYIEEAEIVTDADEE